MVHLECLTFPDELLKILDAGDGQLGFVGSSCSCEVGGDDGGEST
jgi:hypothetical protein